MALLGKRSPTRLMRKGGIDLHNSFVNQLTSKEIGQGLKIYLFRRLLLPILLLGFVVFTVVAMQRYSLSIAAVTAVACVVVALLLYRVLLGRQFSPAKTAVYRLSDDTLTITGSGGASNSYLFSNIKIIAGESVLVLCLTKGSFAIVAKRLINQEQMDLLLSHAKLLSTGNK